MHCSKIGLKMFKLVQGGSVHCTSSHQTFTLITSHSLRLTCDCYHSCQASLTAPLLTSNFFHCHHSCQALLTARLLTIFRGRRSTQPLGGAAAKHSTDARSWMEIDPCRGSILFFPSHAQWLSPGRSTHSIASCIETVN